MNPGRKNYYAFLELEIGDSGHFFLNLAKNKSSYQLEIPLIDFDASVDLSFGLVYDSESRTREYSKYGRGFRNTRDFVRFIPSDCSYIDVSNPDGSITRFDRYASSSSGGIITETYAAPLAHTLIKTKRKTGYPYFEEMRTVSGYDFLTWKTTGSLATTGSRSKTLTSIGELGAQSNCCGDHLDYQITEGRVSQVTLFNKDEKLLQYVRFAYNSVGNLTYATIYLPDEKSSQAGNFIAKRFWYGYQEDKIVTISDRYNHYYARFGYDAEDRIVRIETSRVEDFAIEKTRITEIEYRDKTTIVTDFRGNKMYYYFDDEGKCLGSVDSFGTMNYARYGRLGREYFAESTGTTDSLFSSMISNYAFAEGTVGWDFSGGGTLVDNSIPLLEAGSQIAATLPAGASIEQRIEEYSFLRDNYVLTFLAKGQGTLELLIGKDQEIFKIDDRGGYSVYGLSLTVSEFSKTIKIIAKASAPLTITDFNLKKTSNSQNVTIADELATKIIIHQGSQISYREFSPEYHQISGEKTGSGGFVRVYDEEGGYRWQQTTGDEFQQEYFDAFGRKTRETRSYLGEENLHYFKSTKYLSTFYSYTDETESSYFSKPLKISEKPYVHHLSYDCWGRQVQIIAALEDKKGVKKVYAVLNTDYDYDGKELHTSIINSDLKQSGRNQSWNRYYSYFDETNSDLPIGAVLNHQLYKIIADGQTYSYRYDHRDQPTQFYFGDQLLCETDYDDRREKVVDTDSYFEDIKLAYNYEDYEINSRDRLLSRKIGNAEAPTLSLLDTMSYSDGKRVSSTINFDSRKTETYFNLSGSVRSRSYYAEAKTSPFFMTKYDWDQNGELAAFTAVDYQNGVTGSTVSYEPISRFNSYSVVNLVHEVFENVDYSYCIPIYFLSEEQKQIDLSVIGFDGIYPCETDNVEGEIYDGVLCAKAPYRTNLVYSQVATALQYNIGTWFNSRKKKVTIFKIEQSGGTIEVKYNESGVQVIAKIGSSQAVAITTDDQPMTLSQWNFIGLSVDLEKGKLTLFVNNCEYQGEVGKYASVPTEGKVTFFGNTTNDTVIPAHFTGMIFRRGVILNATIWRRYYRYTAEYLIKNFALSSPFYCTGVEITPLVKVDNADVYPLHNNFLTALGKNEDISSKPYLDLIDNRFEPVPWFDTNHHFRFNNSVGRYMLLLDGNRLRLTNLMNTKGTVLFNASLLPGKEDRVLLQIFESVHSVTLYIPSDTEKKLYLRADNSYYDLDLTVEDYNFFQVGFSYIKKTGNLYAFSISLRCFDQKGNPILKNVTIDHNFPSSLGALTLCLGRDNANEKNHLYGMIEMLAISKNYHAAIDFFDDLIPVSKCTCTYGDQLLRAEQTFIGNRPLSTMIYSYNDADQQPLIRKQNLKLNDGDYHQEYDYDELGRLQIKTAKFDSGVSFYDNRYTYDPKNQLIAYQSRGMRTDFTYSETGNLLLEVRNQDGVEKERHTYSYDADHFQRLIAVDGKTIEYRDRIVGERTIYGIYPISYNRESPLERIDYTWSDLSESKCLTSIAKSGTKVEFKYDSNGVLREKKLINSAGTKTYQYIYSGSKLIEERGPEYIKQVFYDERQRPMALRIKNHQGQAKVDKLLFFILDLTGQIEGLYDENGNNYLLCTYDPFGKVKASYAGSVKDADKLGEPIEVSPLLYKGYLYESNFAYYYCLSRFYNPEWRRWLSGDQTKYLDFDKVLGTNLFIYCGNNPILNYDETGKFAISNLIIFFTIFVGALIGGALAALKAYNRGYTTNEILLSILGGALVGAAKGLALVLGAEIAVSSVLFGLQKSVSIALSTAIAVTSAVAAGGIKSAIDQTLAYGSISNKVLISNMVQAGIDGLLNYAIGTQSGRKGLWTRENGLKNLMRSMQRSSYNMILGSIARGFNDMIFRPINRALDEEEKLNESDNNHVVKLAF